MRNEEDPGLGAGRGLRHPQKWGVPWSGLIRGSWGTRGQLQRLGWGRSVGLTGLSEGKLGEDCGL